MGTRHGGDCAQPTHAREAAQGVEWLDETLRAAVAVLEALGDGPTTWSRLVTVGYQSASPWRINSMIRWLVENGYVDHGYREVYVVNERGLALLAALQPPPLKPGHMDSGLISIK